jgi:hypothetical protein
MNKFISLEYEVIQNNNYQNKKIILYQLKTIYIYYNNNYNHLIYADAFHILL